MSDGRPHASPTLPYVLRDGDIAVAAAGFSDAAAEAIREARLYAEAIVDTIREPLAVLDRDLCIRSVNASFSKLFRVSDNDVLGKRLDEVGGGGGEVPELFARLEGILESRAPIEDLEVLYESEATGPRALLVSARVLQHGDQRPDFILLVIDDVTERRRAEAMLRESDARQHEEDRLRARRIELSKALRMSTVGELVTGLAHELNQPLASIANLVEACAQYVRAGCAEPAKLLELLSGAAEESIRAAGIVAHLRSFIDKGESQLEAVDLTEVVANVPHLLLRDLEKNRVGLRLDFAAEPLPIDADRIQLEQVIVNLIQNAIDSIAEADGAQRLIELSTRRARGRGEVGVRDTGMGISKSDTEKVFSAFFTTKPKGLGMGLALSRSIVEAHRGRIWMEDPADGGAGTVIRFSVPLKARRRQRKERTV